MTLLARNEADILDAHLAFHLNAGVDLVVAIDNGSHDGTTEILERYARDGHVVFTRDAGDPEQAEWVTRLARRAAADLGADWVINADADEFWWPRGGSLKDVFSAVPRRFGGVRGMWRHFAPRPDDGESFAERMVVRVCDPGAQDDSPYSPRYKTAHRGDPSVKVLHGNHTAEGADLTPLPGWYPIDVLHFPIRSLEQCRAKYVRWWQLGPSQFRGAVHDAHQEGRLEEFYERLIVDDAALERGIADGTLAVDTRLRDALRSLRDGEPVAFTDAAVDAGYLSELDALVAGEPHVLAEQKAEALETRLAAVHQTWLSSRI